MIPIQTFFQVLLNLCSSENVNINNPSFLFFIEVCPILFMLWIAGAEVINAINLFPHHLSPFTIDYLMDLICSIF
jgi:hypothetical protein